MRKTEDFLTRGSKNGKATGTLFIIEDGWGYDIQPYSLFPDEAEILIEPESRFKVTGVIESDGLTKIKLQMLPDTLSLNPGYLERDKNKFCLTLNMIEHFNMNITYNNN